MRDISESDWRQLRQLHPLAMERFCQRVLSEVVQLASDTTVNPHERYLVLVDLINRRNDELANGFDDMRRSTALMRLSCIKSQGLLTADEFGRFSETTRNAVEAILSACGPALLAGRRGFA